MEIQIVGFGLAGACTAIECVKRGARVFILDDGKPGSTPVAAGLVNPVAGKNFQPSWRLEEFWPEAKAFYDILDESLFHSLPIFRRWMNDRKKFEKKREMVGPWFAEISDEGVIWSGGGWLDTSRFLDLARIWLLDHGAIFSEKKDALQIHCTGAAGLLRKDFNKIPQRCAKGEILTVKIPGWHEDRILTGGGWLIPLGDDLYRVGATYDWDGLESGPTDRGREQVEDVLRRFTERPYEIVSHVAGVRPIIRRSQPVVHFNQEKGWLFNGLGSKGVIYAPGVARRFAEHLFDGRDLDSGLCLNA